MKSLIKKITQNEIIVNTLYVIFLLIAFGFIILTRELNDLDEIWNFGFGLNVSEGLAPYKDFNMIMTPFSAFLSAAVLAVFGRRLMVLRIFSVVLSAAAVFVLYKIIVKMGISRSRAAMYGILSIIFFGTVFRYDYNFLCMLLLLILIYIQLCSIDGFSIKTEIAIGFVAGLCAVTKQSTGLFICMGIALQSIVCYGKDFFKSWLYRILGGGTVLAALLIYMLAAGNLADFYDFAVAGIKTFTNENNYISFLINGDVIEKTVGIGAPIVTVAFIIHTVRRKEKRKVNLTVLIMCLCGAVVMYPICDPAHFFIAVLPFMIMLAATVRIKPSGIEMSVACIAVMYLFVFAKTYLFMPTGDIINCRLNRYENIPISTSLNSTVEEVDEYILTSREQGKRVIICDTAAQAYMIPCNIYNKVYDLLCIGNLGTKKPAEYAQDLVNSPDTAVLLLRNPEYLNWQFPTEMRECILQNMTKTGEVAIFDVYEVVKENG